MQNSYPLMNVNDILVIELRDYEPNAYLSVKALTDNLQLTLQAYFDVESMPEANVVPAPAATANYSLVQARTSMRINIPEGGNRQNRVSRLLVTNGEAQVDVISPTPMRSYFEQPPPLANY